MNDSYYNEKFNGYISAIDANLSEVFMSDCKVEEAMRYTLSAGGKRIRPVLALAVCDMLSKSPEKAVCYACAIELIHTYSLIHDDLPCMDNDDIRRGKPASHVAFGETIALLAGDGLLTKAFTLAAKGGNPKAVEVISDNAYAMVIGQADEFLNEGNGVSVDDILKIYAEKTGALLVAAAVCGAIAAGADDETVKRMNEFALNLGLAFQVIDDLLDADTEDCALISALGKDGAEKLAAEFTQKAIDSISGYYGNDFLMTLTDKLLHRDR